MWDGIQSSLNSAEKKSQPDYILEQLISAWNYPITDHTVSQMEFSAEKKACVELHGA